MITVGGHAIWQGDALEILRGLPENHYGACVTDPPYHLTNVEADGVICGTCRKSPPADKGKGNGFGNGQAGDPCPRCGGTLIRRRSGHESRNPARGYPHRDGAAGEWDDTGRKRAEAAGGFMGMKWDGGDIAFRPEFWREVYRVLKPGAYLVAFSAARTYHRMATAIEDAGFIVRDMLEWSYGSGFPKRHDISKAFDRANGAKRGKKRTTTGHRAGVLRYEGQNNRPYMDRALETGYHEFDDDTPITQEAIEWQGYDVALKPSHEPIVLAQKPREGTYTDNIRKWGVGALNIDKCRIPTDEKLHEPGPHGGIKGDAWRTMEGRDADDLRRGRLGGARDGAVYGDRFEQGFEYRANPAGRYPPNQLFSHSLFCTPAGCDPSCPIGRMDRFGPKRKPTPGKVAQSGISRYTDWEIQEGNQWPENGPRGDTSAGVTGDGTASGASPVVENSTANLNPDGSGSAITDQSRRDMKSTTATTIKPTTRRKTSNSSPRNGTTTTTNDGASITGSPPTEAPSAGAASAASGNRSASTTSAAPGHTPGTAKSVQSDPSESGRRQIATHSTHVAGTNTEQRDGPSAYFPILDWSEGDYWWAHYTPKPGKREKTAGTADPDTGESSQTHVTVKPLSVMGWLLDLVLPKGETAIDPFAGSGTTLCAARQRKMKCDGIELLADHVAIIRDRLNANPIKGWE